MEEGGRGSVGSKSEVFEMCARTNSNQIHNPMAKEDLCMRLLELQ